MKGAYNASDLNRVSAAMLYIKSRFEGYGYAVNINPKTTWSVEDIPTQAEMSKYLDDLRTLRGMVSVYTTTPTVPTTANKLSYIQANNIEKILEDIDELLTKLSMAWFYSGDVYCGEI